MIGLNIARAIGILGEIITWIIVVRSLLTWFPNLRSGAIMRMLDALVEPIVAPFRALLAKLIRQPMMVDFSPLLAMLAIYYIIVPLLQTLVLKIFVS